MYNQKKQILLDKFVIHIIKNYIKIFEHKTVEDMIIDQDNNIEIEFSKFMGKERVDIKIYETINKNKFIELALSYVLDIYKSKEF